MKFQYCYFGLIDNTGHQTLIEHLKLINNIVLKSNLTGVFYYANQSFFCCLEGDFDQILNIIAKLNISRFFKPCYVIANYIDILPNHKQWSMRYVHHNSKIMQFFHEHGYTYFKPLELNGTARKYLVKLILNQSEIPTQKKHSKGYKYRGAYFY